MKLSKDYFIEGFLLKEGTEIKIKESNSQRIVFECKYKYFKDDLLNDLWELVESDYQIYFTIEDIMIYEGDDEDEYMVHFIGYGKDSNSYMDFVRFINKKSPFKMEFERIIP